jgi:hypothetical protein
MSFDPISTPLGFIRGNDVPTQTPVDVASTAPVQFVPAPTPVVPTPFVPTPTIQYRQRRKLMKTTISTEVATPDMVPTPPASPIGARVLIWKQDPTVGELGVRKAYIHSLVAAGPKDTRIWIQGVPPVTPNILGDFIQTPGTPEFDAVHTFAIVRQTLTMFERALSSPGSSPVQVPWQWNRRDGNTAPLLVFPLHSNMINAFYSRQEKTLAFGFFNKPNTPPTSPLIFTCRSLDIVAHETGHAILDALKPDWLAFSAPPQTGGLHESFGDLTAIFLALSQMDQVEALIAHTKANLHEKQFLADLAEEFGLALGRPNGLRNADNDLKLSEVGTEVHAISQVFTGGIYDVLADIFEWEWRQTTKDAAAVLYEAGQYVFSLVLRAILAAPDQNATYADVVNQMLRIADGKPEYQEFIKKRFVFRQVVVSPPSLMEALANGKLLEPDPHVQYSTDVPQIRIRCCGTMQSQEFTGGQATMDAEVASLQQGFNAFRATLDSLAQGNGASRSAARKGQSGS